MIDFASVLAEVSGSVNRRIVFDLLFVLSCSAVMIYVVRTSIVAPVSRCIHQLLVLVIGTKINIKSVKTIYDITFGDETFL